MSLHKCVTRTIYRWPALLSYFNSHKDGDEDGKVRRVADQLESPEMKMYFQFLEFILAPFSEFNTVFKVSLINLINYQSKNFEDLHLWQSSEFIRIIFSGFYLTNWQFEGSNIQDLKVVPGKNPESICYCFLLWSNKVSLLDIRCKLDDDLLAKGLKNRELSQEQRDLPMEKEKKDVLGNLKKTAHTCFSLRIQVECPNKWNYNSLFSE